MITLILAVLVSQAIPSASPAPTVSVAPPLATQLAPEWIVAPLKASDYAHFVRHEQDGTDSDISASQQFCDCQPDDAMKMLESILGPVRGVSTQTSSITACGQPADRMLVTGLAAPKNSQRNLEVVMFRSGGALYSLTYSFRYGAPMTDAESALLTLCGKSPS
jgi:hypothetical protein